MRSCFQGKQAKEENGTWGSQTMVLSQKIPHTNTFFSLSPPPPSFSSPCSSSSRQLKHIDYLLCSKHHGKCFYPLLCSILTTNPHHHLHFTNEDTKVHGDSAPAQGSRSSSEPTKQYSLLQHFTASNPFCESGANEGVISKKISHMHVPIRLRSLFTPQLYHHLLKAWFLPQSCLVPPQDSNSNKYAD